MSARRVAVSSTDWLDGLRGFIPAAESCDATLPIIEPPVEVFADYHDLATVEEALWLAKDVSPRYRYAILVTVA